MQNTGTSANSNGEYRVPLLAGHYNIRFEAMGYKSVRKEVVIASNFETIDVVLNEQSFQLNEVIIDNKQEDPAYPIMRKAIGLAPFHLNQVKSYTADIYLRGTLEILTIPWILRNQIKVNEIPIKAGDLFSQESVNEVKFEAPDKYQQRVVSMKSNFPESTSNPIQNYGESFYQPTLNGLISPLSPYAFSYYRFIYEGFSKENGVIICKIRVEPRRESTELYSGYIFIVEDCWALHSLNLTMSNSYGTIQLKQISTPVVDDAWLPISYNIKAGGSLLGISGGFVYSGSVKYSAVQTNLALVRPSILKPLTTSDSSLASKPKQIFKKVKNQKILEEIQKKDKLTNRDMIRLAQISMEEAKSDTLRENQSLEVKDHSTVIVEKDATKKDSSYWNSIRPIPLSKNEMKALQPSLALAQKDSVPKDSTVEKLGLFGKTLRTLAFGNDLKLGSDSSLTLWYNGVIGIRQAAYNTVDGLVYKQFGGAHWQVDSVHALRVEPEIGYAFARKKLMGQLNLSYSYAPLKRGLLETKFGSHSTDFNQGSGINSFINSGYTLFMRQNFAKYFNNNFASISNQIDVANGFVCTAKLTYAQQDTLENNSSYSFFYNQSRLFSSNTPNNVDYKSYTTSSYKSFVVDVKLEYTPFQYYRIKKGAKKLEYSKYPTLSLEYQKGFADVFASNSNFDFLQVGVNQHVNLVGSRSLSYAVNGGAFLAKRELFFTNFKHFNTQNIEVNFGNFDNSFTLLDYYKYSSSNYFVESHIQYSTPYLLVKLLSPFRKQLWTESLYVKYLTNEHINNYCETGYSMNRIFMVANVAIFASFENGTFKQVGFRLGISF